MPDTTPAAPAAPAAAPAQQTQQPGQGTSPFTGLAPELAQKVSKFTSLEALAAGYAELEQKLTSTTGGGGPQDQQQQQQAPPVSDALSAVQTELYKTGKLSEETRAKYGIAPEIAARAEAAVSAHGDLYRNQIMLEAGSQEDYVAMQQWAAAALPAEEKEEFNKLVNSGNINVAAPAVKGLYARWQAATQDPANQVKGRNSLPGVQPFKSRAEMLAAMDDKRYGLGDGGVHRDDNYIAEVQARAAAARQQGIAL